MKTLSIVVLALVASAALFAVTLGPLRPDNAPPRSVSGGVEVARAALAANMGGASFRFVSASCRSDGGAVLIFEERSFPWSRNTLAYASTDSWPPVRWVAHVRLSVHEYNNEIGKFMGPDQNRECTAR